MDKYIFLHIVVTVISVIGYVKYAVLFWKTERENPDWDRYRVFYYSSFILFFFGNITIGLFRANL